MKLFLTSVNIETSSSSFRSARVIVVVNLPINSGIIPNLVRSSGTTDARSLVSFLYFISAPNPIDDPLVLLLMMFSSPTKAPPAMNRIFFVSTSIISPWGWFLFPAGLTRHLVPSTNLSNACCTPSPDTSRVIELLSLLRDILSTSSIKTIPCSASLTSLFAIDSSIDIIPSTSSPTYPASVRLVASATTKGTLRYFATDLASRVLPEPVGPIRRTFPFWISRSEGGLLIRL